MLNAVTTRPGARVLRLPRTPAGRALLRETLVTIKDADIRAYVMDLFDWDESAIFEEEAERRQRGAM